MTTNNIPQGYKDSPLGIIPQEWEVKRLEDVVDPNRKISYGIVQTGEPSPNGIPCIRVIDLVDGKIDKMRLITTSEEINRSYRKTIVKSGDIVMALRGKVGESVLITDELLGCNLTRGVALISNYQNVYSQFLIQQISSPLMKVEFEKKMNGSALQEIPINVLRSIEIAIPPLPEQQKIAEILGCWDEAIERQTKMVDLLTTRKRALMQRLLKPKEHWEKVKLGEICKINKGKALSSKDLKDGDYPVIAGGQSSPYTHSEFTDENVITISASGAYAGYIAYHNYRIWASDCSVIKEIQNKSNINFLFHFLTHIQQFIYSLQSGGAQPHIFPKDIAKLKYNFPPLPEQKIIAKKLSTADAEIDLARRCLELLRTQKKGLMQQLSTGKKRVKI